FFFFSSRRRHTRFSRDWSSDVCSSDLAHACGVTEPRQLRRSHVHVVAASGLSVPLSELHPEPITLIDDQARPEEPERQISANQRSEERRVGKEGRSRGSPVR